MPNSKNMNFLLAFTPIKLLVSGLWRDEGFSYLMARQSLINIVVTTSRDFNPPLYYFLLHYWMIIFGSSEIAMRSLSLIFFAISVYVVYAFLKNIIHIKSAFIWIYVLLYAVNPFLLYYAFEARMYSLVTLLTILSFYLFLTKNKKGYIIISVLGLYTHYFFIFVLLTQGAYAYFFEKQTFKILRKQIGQAFLFFIPWVVFCLPTLVSKTTDFWIKTPTLRDLFISPMVMFSGYEANYYGFYNSFIIIFSLILFVILGFFLTQVKKTNLYYLLLMWAFMSFYAIFFISFIKPIYTIRYLIFAAVGFNIFLYYCLEKTSLKMRSIILIFLLVVTLHFWVLQVAYRTKGAEKNTIQSIKNLASSEDILYVTDSSKYFVASYYFGVGRVYIYKNNVTDVPYYIGEVLIPDNRVVTDLPHLPIRAFILETDTSFTIKTAY